MKPKMTISTVRVTDKGQISLPAGICREMGIARGDTLILSHSADVILLEKQERLEPIIEDDMKDILKLTEKSLKEVWDNKEDDIWNVYLKKK